MDISLINPLPSLLLATMDFDAIFLFVFIITVIVIIIASVII